MKEETFEKARYLQGCIADINNLLHSKKAQFGSMLIRVSCANSNMYDDYWGRIDKKTWDKMLAVLTEERDTLKRKLAALTDDSEDDAETDIPTEQVQRDDDSEKTLTTANKSRQCLLVNGMVILYGWMLFCIIYWLLGFSNWITAVSNTLLTAFVIYLLDIERRRIRHNKED